jgi:hypothetical protein
MPPNERWSTQGRPRPKTPADKAQECHAVQLRLKEEAAARRESRAAAQKPRQAPTR